MPASSPRHLSRPRLALNIGISGHRPNKLVSPSITAKKFAAFASQCDAAVKSILAGESGRFYSSEAPVIRLVTGLAEGADRLVLEHLPAQWQFEAVLPMPRSEYRKDFRGKARSAFDAWLARAVSVTELPLQDSADPRQQANRAHYYDALGEFLIRQINILLVIWDGKEAEGPGGTGDIAMKALDAGLPVIWLSLKAEEAPKLLTLTEDGHRSVELDPNELSGILQHILGPPQVTQDKAGHDGHHASTPEDKLDYLTHPWPGSLYLPFAYNLLRKLSGAGRFSWPMHYGSETQQLKSWQPFFAAMPAQTEMLQQNLSATLLPRSVWADALAWYYGQLYRSAYVSIFILAALSVPIGLCYLFFLTSPAVLHIKAAFVVMELAIIGTVIAVVRRGVRANWHGQWLATRKLSELLRLGRNLVYVGASRGFVPAPAQGEHEDLAGWYVRATFRETGLPSAVLDQPYLSAVLEGINQTEIIQQRAYHRSNAHNLHKIHHLLHRAGDLCFMATIGFLLFYLAVWGIDTFLVTVNAGAEEVAGAAHEAGEGSWLHEVLEYAVKPIVSIAAAGLPALGAGLTGIREQGDFEGFAERSHSTQAQLAAVEGRIKELLADPRRLDLAHAHEVLLSATESMARDVTDWHHQFSSKRLSLPA